MRCAVPKSEHKEWEVARRPASTRNAGIVSQSPSYLVTWKVQRREHLKLLRRKSRWRLWRLRRDFTAHSSCILQGYIWNECMAANIFYKYIFQQLFNKLRGICTAASCRIDWHITPHNPVWDNVTKFQIVYNQCRRVLLLLLNKHHRQFSENSKVLMIQFYRITSINVLAMSHTLMYILQPFFFTFSLT